MRVGQKKMWAGEGMWEEAYFLLTFLFRFCVKTKMKNRHFAISL